jgi:hypothetical protein
MDQQFGLDESLSVTQLYIQIDAKGIQNDDGKDVIYSFPPVDTLDQDKGDVLAKNIAKTPP